MSLIAIDLLKEEIVPYEYKFRLGLTVDDVKRIQTLKDAIQELQLITESDCKNCRYNLTQEDLSKLNDEEYLAAFDKCRTCSNYYPNNYEEIND
jgi:hypothetical protein